MFEQHQLQLRRHHHMGEIGEQHGGDDDLESAIAEDFAIMELLRGIGRGRLTRGTGAARYQQKC